jgi:hypothetical protein
MNRRYGDVSNVEERRGEERRGEGLSWLRLRVQEAERPCLG